MIFDLPAIKIKRFSFVVSAGLRPRFYTEC